MQALDIYINTIRELISEGEIEQALDTLTKLNVSTNLDMGNTLINLKGQYKRLQREVDEGYLDRRDARIDMNRIQRAITNLLEDVPRKLELRGKINGVTGYNFGVGESDTFEKIIGSEDNLLKISWLEQALAAAKSVCLIVGADTSRGTGFMIDDNYLITNNHVIPDAEFARTAYIEFNFEEDGAGSQKERYRYELDADDFLTSDKYELDVTRVRVKENTNALPLSFWGHLKLAPKNVPRSGDPVTIIQHAAGEQKRIALNANQVLGTKNQYLFYQTDTLAGSSGSPVFNRNWEVVALHHAGSNFQGKEANRGVLLQPILDYFARQPTDLPRDSGTAATENTVPTPPKTQPPQSDLEHSKKYLAYMSDERTRFLLLYNFAADEQYAKTLKKHLSPLIHITREITVFDWNQDVVPGHHIRNTVEEILKKSDFILVLVTPDLFADAEVFSGDNAFVTLAQKENKKIIPILVRNTYFFELSSIGRLHGLPTSGRFISEWQNEDDAFTNVAQQIRLLHQKK